ncbi:hypothetical protein BGZ99_007301 [Dissophora globulifera]|uniref:Uncharacterized protein n=1 Tax=Dissophora globulifera TaxID=979702 RepID=A0A9P6RS27_9FUNG|nr:hypothetical protein BGZ99_007301 [Dissophora globulifera]
MESLADEDAGLVFWEDFCDLHGWLRTPNVANIRRYAEVFVNDKEQEINQRRNDMGYISGHDLFIKPVLRLQAQLLADNNINGRDWHNVFNPILWSDIVDYDQDYPSLFIDTVVATRSLEKYGHHIRTLKIKCLDNDLQRLLAVAPDRFSRLHSIELIGFESSDDALANLLRRCSRGCGGVGLRRVVVLTSDDWSCWRFDEFDFGKKSVEALKDHFPTLEVLRTEAAWFSSKDIQGLLCSSSRLKVFNILPKDRRQSVDQSLPWLDANDAVQTDWACTSLVVFGCPIGGIRRNSESCVLKDKDQKMSAALHNGVYSQLGRLTHLEELRMGIPYDSEGLDYHRHDKKNDRQYDCLSMSLESGLGLLSGLKNLRVVALEDMEVDIDGDNERKWIEEHWPNARVVTTDDWTDRDDDSQLSGFYDEDSEEDLSVILNGLTLIILITLMRVYFYDLSGTSPIRN